MPKHSRYVHRLSLTSFSVIGGVGGVILIRFRGLPVWTGWLFIGVALVIVIPSTRIILSK